MGTPPIGCGNRFDEKTPGVFLPGACFDSSYFCLAAD
jgi:hypothetical protein